MSINRRLRIRKAVATLGASLMLAGALVAAPTAAQAGTIVESKSFKNQTQCNASRGSLMIQGYNVGPCQMHGTDLTWWTFWFETK